MTVLRTSLAGLFFLFPIYILNAQEVIPYHPCSDCHLSDGWIPLSPKAVTIHENTLMPLRGKHALAECIQCHSGSTNQERHYFLKVERECGTCHFDVHLGEFSVDCGLCHSYESWEMTDWRKKHDQTLFNLTGAHFTLECSDCHVPMFAGQGEFLPTDCISCHQEVFTVATLSLQGHPSNEDCIVCHSTFAWLPTDMSNHDLLFPIFSGRHRGTWSTCEAECHIYREDFNRFSCGLNGTCHEHDKSEMDDEHREKVRNYVYESTACLDCHPSGSE